MQQDRDRLITGYARALFAVAEAEGDLDRVEDELYRFAKSVEAEPGLRQALTDPQLPAERKRALVTELLGRRANPHTVNLLGFLVESGRGRDLQRIVEKLAELAAERRELAFAEVRTAIPLDAERRERLTAALSRATGRTVELRVLVDPGVIGGAVARVGDEVIDGSIRRRLQLAREQLGRAR
jgi:F-type H+-transporting ATPase subunit delta